jgi:CheY-like chemotaxis protein
MLWKRLKFETSSYKFQGAGMLSIVMVTPEPNNLRELAKLLKSNPQVRIQWVKNSEGAIEITSRATPALMILDARPEDISIFQMVRDLIMVNAGIPVAVVSQMPDNEFEAAGEGLGILAQLIPNPGRAEAQMLISKLKMLKTLF